MMSNSHEQSLDENVVFSPVTESSPEFFHCEAERCALEQLLSTGPGAFYTELSKERLTHFLSPDEVNQVSSWAEDFRISEVLLDDGELEEEAGSETQGFSVQYFPELSDAPAPCLELGWPENGRWAGVDRAMVYTNPPVEQAPHIREVIRRLLQGANMLIAIVMDRVTDSAVISDLHFAASRGVPVYIILNRRSVQENFTPNRLRHPNIRVRTVGGKTFLSRDGKMVVGEMKENFILVDLETVVLGSYSLTWTDAHLHRQLITVLNGSAVEAFDREFRVLYAASLPVPDMWKSCRPVGVSGIDRPHTLYQPEYLEPYNHKAMLIDKPSSPPPPPDCLLDWESMGVVQWNQDLPEGPDLLSGLGEKLPQHHRPDLNGLPGAAGDRGGPGGEELERIEHQVEDRLYSSITAEPRHITDHQTMFGIMPKPVQYKRFSLALDTEWESIFRSREPRMDTQLKEESGVFSHTHRRDFSGRMDRNLGEKIIPEESTSHSSAATNHKKPLILSVPQSESFSSLSDIMRRINARQSAKEQQKRTAKTTVSKSLLDLSAAGATGADNLYDNLPLTPALALIKKRNDEVKSGLLRAPRTFLSSRPRSSSFGLQRESWRPPFLREQRSEENK